jgi:hypothetical protein
MSTRSSLCSFVLLLLCSGILAGCGLEDSEAVVCRCTEDTNLNLFPHCFDAAVEGARQDPANPLTTRTPDCPSGSPLFLREPTDPVLVLLNLRTTVEKLNSVRYMEQFAANFVFVPDREDIDLHPEIYQAPENYDPDRDTLWTWEQERFFATELLNSEKFQDPDFIRWYKSNLDEVIPSEDGLMETYIFPYEIDFAEQPREGETNRFGLKGQMIIVFTTPTPENPIWTIQRWEDQRDPASAKRSWGELRAEFAR